jgi:hypothetical protein
MTDVSQASKVTYPDKADRADNQDEKLRKLKQMLREEY